MCAICSAGRVQDFPLAALIPLITTGGPDTTGVVGDGGEDVHDLSKWAT